APMIQYDTAFQLNRKNKKPRNNFQNLFIALLLLFPFSVNGQQNSAQSANVSNSESIVVSGIVRDVTTNEALPSVNILVKGTSIGAATNQNGYYKIEVLSVNDTLRFSFVGYQTKFIPINRRTDIDVSLQPATNKLKELVVLGYSKQA